MTLQELRGWLADLAAVEATVPARVVLARLPSLEAPGEQHGPGDVTADLTAEQAGQLLGRSASTIREYARAELLENAYRQRGREWRIPRAAITAFQRAAAAARTAPAEQRRAAQGGAVDLGAWRKERAS